MPIANMKTQRNTYLRDFWTFISVMDFENYYLLKKVHFRYVWTMWSFRVRIFATWYGSKVFRNLWQRRSKTNGSITEKFIRDHFRKYTTLNRTLEYKLRTLKFPKDESEVQNSAAWRKIWKFLKTCTQEIVKLSFIWTMFEGDGLSVKIAYQW